MDEIQNENKSKIIDVDLEKEVQKSFMAYSMSVIVQRALPDVRDGLKPVHRRILYAMYEDGITPDKPYKKCATTVGDVLGRYHPHGDASVYDALVRLAQDFSMRYMLVDGHGNFGSVDGDPPAAYRYTESRMSRLSVEMLRDIDKDTVDFGSNFDDSRKEPTVLPGHFPNLLVNGSTGIAVGMATNIPPHNMGEVLDGVCALIDDPDIGLEGLMQYIKGPDFPTAGIIMGRAGIRAAYATGRGRITVRARAEIVEEKNGRFSIVVTELPYQVNKARLIENMADLVKNKRITGISNIEDHSDRNGMHILITLKRDASPQIILNQLYSYTQLQTTFSVNMLAIVGAHGSYSGEPKLLTLKQILQEYVAFQKDVITRRTKYDLKKALARAHILEGLKIAVDNIDEIIAIIRSSRDRAAARARMTERFGLDDIQTQAIVQMPLGALTGLERKKLEEELAAIEAKVADLRDILAHEERVLAIIKEDAQNVKKKFGDERRTEIVSVSGEVDIEDLIPDEECVLTLTNFGYAKRLAADTYHTQNRGGRGISAMTRRDEDFASEMFVCGSHDYVLFFTNFGRVYRLKCYEVPEGSRTSKGVNIANLLPISQGESVTSMIRVPEFDDESYLCMVTRNGIIKRTALSAYNTARKGGVIALGLDDGDELCWVRLTSGDDELLVATHFGMAIRFNENDVRPMGRAARGVKAITLKESDYVVGMSILREGGRVLTVSETGFGRLSPIEDYRIQNRGGKGLTNYHIDKYGCVAGIKVVDLTDDIILISEDGILIRIPADSIRICSRPSKGVKVMRLNGTDKVVTLARTEHEEDVQMDELPDNGDNDDETEGADDSAETEDQQPEEQEEN
ncbi:DNA gyrase subunit A [Caproicibacterium lactatifermentans]|jgi:DNA gyrase subunit A|uniref:DNA gyrase subunit A n=1 Tax=Caproicibacterium lactatifermentans TaxID=2666138 RepID=A0A859DQF6_9FIRM|nr:DNA gyrase subunit A [Caproicibacterium lactatifermentans]MDD4807236.1 DNA gyrase subunit A [Oscillospiraceae bacterium]QKN23012.1 DNA gyrase subunit A [Caproicibacterium lactatifermentans]QKO30382.1 DNA gyrase subunit A [Caproicibacterium lactatifermentans]